MDEVFGTRRLDHDKPADRPTWLRILLRLAAMLAWFAASLVEAALVDLIHISGPATGRSLGRNSTVAAVQADPTLTAAARTGPTDAVFHEQSIP